MALSLKDMFKGLRNGKTTEEQAEQFEAAVRAVAAEMIADAKPAPAPTLQPKPGERVVMGAEERLALGRELQVDHETFAARQERQAERVTEYQARREATIAALDREWQSIYDDAPDSAPHCAKRDATWARMWAERSPLVDVLISQVREEAFMLPTEEASLPGKKMPATFADMQRKAVSNADSAQARRVALRELGEEIEKRTKRGLYGDDTDLRAWFDAAYRALPRVKPLRDVMRDARAVVGHFPPSAA